MSVVKVQLGDFVFEAFEVPESIPVGGGQKLVVHQLVGGQRVVDAMGRDDMDLAWSGLFLGSAALARATYLDSLRVAGKPLNLTWSQFNYTVIIADFHFPYEKFYKLPYQITLKVVKDNTLPTPSFVPTGYDAAIMGDMGLANGFGSLIGDLGLTGALGTLGTAVSAVSSFAQAAQSTINTVLTPLLAVQSYAKTMIASAENTVRSVTTLGGILPNNPIANQAAGLINQVNATAQLPNLYGLQSVLGRMGSNLSAVNNLPSGQTIIQSGGNLFSLAEKYYGDATKWAGIAQANNLTDTQLTGVNTLIIPANPQDTGGVYVK
jgi:hypothetical protein